MDIKLFEIFTVPPDRAEEFFKSWRHTAQIFAQQPGFISAQVHRNAGVGDSKFMFVNVAYWQSVQAWQTAHRGY